MSEEFKVYDDMTPEELMKSARGKMLLGEALYYAAKHIEAMPDVCQPSNNRDDMLKILHGCFPGVAERCAANDRKWEELLDPRTGALRDFAGDSRTPRH